MISILDYGAGNLRSVENTLQAIGVEYEPEEWLVEVRSGTPGEDLLARKSDLPVSPIRSAVGAGFGPPGG